MTPPRPTVHRAAGEISTPPPLRESRRATGGQGPSTTKASPPRGGGARGTTPPPVAFKSLVMFYKKAKACNSGFSALGSGPGARAADYLSGDKEFKTSGTRPIA